MIINYRLWLAKFPNKSVQGIFKHNTGTRYFSDGIFGFPSHKSFQVCQLDVITQTGGVESTYKLAILFMPM